ncbi:MAG: prepilin-type N-terminal cleavage/methylation domain-containing protein [Micavibrio sp.]
MTSHKNKGFTLVELAIVMTIIGLLVGGILAGQELISNSRIRAVMTTVKKIQTSASAYQQKYGQLPGDHNLATERLPGCDAANHCRNGNADGMIGQPATTYHNNNQIGMTSMPAMETAQFWKHLLLAGYIGGVLPAADPASPTWGTTHPRCDGCGGFTMVYLQQTAAEYPYRGNYIMLRAYPDGSPDPSGGPNRGAVKPQWAREIDEKMDNGFAQSGDVLSYHNNGLCSNAATGEYETAQGDKNCVMIFRLYN